ncbi:MAG: flagellar biosynthetic protein FliO [Phycisphaerales bacterium]|nr:flagellar biosynthetic protein FliO [Phycisphaerales bacterium]
MSSVRNALFYVASSVLVLGLAGQVSGATAPEGATSPEVATAAPANPVNESKALGAPNSLFSSRPAASETSSSSLSMLDPRQNDVVRVLLALGFVVALLLGVRFVMRRAGGTLAGGGRPSGVVQVHGRYPAGRGQSMLLIQVGDRMILVHQGGGRMQTLTEFSEPKDVADLRTRLEAGRQGTGRLLSFNGVLTREQDKATEEMESGETVDLTQGNAGRLRRRLLGGRRLA